MPAGQRRHARMHMQQYQPARAQLCVPGCCRSGCWVQALAHTCGTAAGKVAEQWQSRAQRQGFQEPRTLNPAISWVVSFLTPPPACCRSWCRVQAVTDVSGTAVAGAKGRGASGASQPCLPGGTAYSLDSGTYLFQVRLCTAARSAFESSCHTIAKGGMKTHRRLCATRHCGSF